MTSEREKRRAIFRVILGNAQMFGAVVTLVLAWQLGVGKATVTAAAITVALLLTSLVVFRLR